MTQNASCWESELDGFQLWVMHYVPAGDEAQIVKEKKITACPEAVMWEEEFVSASWHVFSKGFWFPIS